MADKVRVSDMTVDELIARLRDEMRALVREAVSEALAEATPPPTKRPSLDDFPVDDLGPWPEGLTLRREEMYGDQGR